MTDKKISSINIVRKKITSKGVIMTRKHYEMIARVLNNRAKAIINSSASNEEKHYALFELRTTMYNFCDELEKENPKFDKIRFINKCNINRPFFNLKVDIVTS